MKHWILICLGLVTVCPDAFGQAYVLPSSASGGLIPYPYAGGTYTTWHSDPISVAAISDGSATTSVPLTGLDQVLQDNGVHADLGTFYLLRYELPLSAPEFHIEFTADVQYPGGLEEFWIDAVHRDGVSIRSVFRETNASAPHTFGLTFTRTHNDGNQGATGRAWGLGDLQQADGSILIVLQGAYYAQIDHPGAITTTLYDVSASVVPEPDPTTVALFSVGSIAMVAFMRRYAR